MNDTTHTLAVVTLAPHRAHFFCGLAALVTASAWWALHLLARYTGVPLFALDLTIAPIWAHSFLMLFAVFPTVIFGFLFTVYPRWMNGPLVHRAVYQLLAKYRVVLSGRDATERKAAQWVKTQRSGT